MIVQSGLIIWFVESAIPVAAAVTIGTLIVGVAFFPTQWESVGLADLHVISLPAWIGQNAWALLAGIGCYVIIGIGWATFRWWMLARELREAYERAKTEWLAPGNLRATANALQSHAECCRETSLREKYLLWSEACRTAAADGGNHLTRELKPIWKEFVTNGPSYDPRQARIGIEGLTRPDPEERSAQIVSWVICWPWHIAWTFSVYNPLRYVGAFLLQELQSALFEISETQFSSIERDLALDPSVPHAAPERQSPTNAGFTPAPAAEYSATIDSQPGFASSVGDGRNREQLKTIDAESARQTSLDSNAERQPGRPSDTPNDANNFVPKNTAQAPVSGESSNSYAWTPPQPTPFVAVSNRPLRGLKFPGGSGQSGETESTGSSPSRPADQ